MQDNNARDLIAEWRRILAPYDHAGGSRSGRLRLKRFWNQRLMCLGGLADITTPTTARKNELQDLGLGSRSIRIGKNRFPAQDL